MGNFRATSAKIALKGKPWRRTALLSQTPSAIISALTVTISNRLFPHASVVRNAVETSTTKRQRIALVAKINAKCDIQVNLARKRSVVQRWRMARSQRPLCCFMTAPLRKQRLKISRKPPQQFGRQPKETVSHHFPAIRWNIKKKTTKPCSILFVRW